MFLIFVVLISRPDNFSDCSYYSGSEPSTPTLNELESSKSQKVEFTAQAAELRRNFYQFQRAISGLGSFADPYLQSLKKHLHFKVDKTLDPQGLADYFERVLFKLAKNPKQARKNWSEDETILLINTIIYYCLFRGEECHSLVMPTLNVHLILSLLE